MPPPERADQIRIDLAQIVKKSVRYSYGKSITITTSGPRQYTRELAGNLGLGSVIDTIKGGWNTNDVFGHTIQYRDNSLMFIETVDGSELTSASGICFDTKAYLSFSGFK